MPRWRDLALAWRLLRRDARAGELRVLAAAIVVAVASVATVAFFADRVKGALFLQANLLLGGDARVSGDRPLPPAFEEEARRLGLAVNRGVRFNSMVQARGEAVLADVKAVEPGYPLRGEIVLARSGDAAGDAGAGAPAGEVTREVPLPGTVWVDTRLAQRLAVAVGDRVTVGQAELAVGAVMLQEPEMSGGFLNLAPRLLLNAADLPATELLLPGNRATYRLFVAGERADAFRERVRPRLLAGQRLDTIRDVRPEVRVTLERAERFLGLASLVAVILAGVAVALAARRFLRRHLDGVAVMRCLGAPQRQVLTLYAAQFLILGALASVAGLLAGLVGQQALVAVLGALVRAELPWPGPMPAWQALATGFVLLLGFGLPPLVALAKVPPLRVLRRDLGVPGAGGIVGYALGAAAVAALIAWQAGEARIAGIMLGGVVAVLLAALACAFLLLRLVQLVPQRGYSWRYGLANLRRRPLSSSIQIGALGLGLMALLLLTVVRGDLLATWRASLPPDAPDKFLINIQPDQVDALGSFLRREIGVETAFAPMVRGRLVEVNGRPVSPADYSDERAKRLVDREFNLSWSETVPTGNRVVAGRWWRPGETAILSLEDGIAETLRLGLGDRLTYDIAGTRLDVEVVNLRKVDWDAFRVNFFAVMPPGLLEPMPRSHITAFRLPAGREGALSDLVREFPNVLLIDVGEIMRQVQRIMDQVSRAVEFVFLFTLASGLLVLQAAIAATQDERRFDTAVLRTLGARAGQVRAAQLAEFAALGALAGLLAALGATGVGWALAERVLQVPYRPDPWLWAIGLAAGTVAVAAAGWLGTRATVRQPPLVALNEAA